jgi:aspartate racemase
MKRIGLIGGVSWKSTIDYYSALNQMAQSKYGGNHSAPMLIASVEFSEIDRLCHAGDWKNLATILSNEARRLEQGGAELLAICANTLHKVEKQVAASVNIPLLSILDGVVATIEKQRIGKVGLVGTRFTMTDGFYQHKLASHNITTTLPSAELQQSIHNIIYNELTQAIVSDHGKHTMKQITSELREAGCQGVILGCTELPLLIEQGASSALLLNTTHIHTQQIFNAAH